MQFLTDLRNHIDQLENAIEKSYAALPARLLATLKADPLVSVCLFGLGVLAGLVL